MYIQHENIRLDDGKPVVCNEPTIPLGETPHLE